MAIGNTNDQNVGSSKMTNLPNSVNFIPVLSRGSKRGNRLASNKRTLSAQKENRKGRAISLKSILDNKNIGLHNKNLPKITINFARKRSQGTASALLSGT